MFFAKENGEKQGGVLSSRALFVCSSSSNLLTKIYTWGEARVII